jgi:membrane-associated phospholipid phosphatase
MIAWDHTLFRWINYEWSNGFFDIFLVWIRHPLFWAPLYVFTIAFLLLNFKQKGYYYLLFLILTFGTADLLSSRIFKPLFKRLRPCNDDMIDVVERVRCGVGYSFTSSHAANHFALATFVIFTLGMMFPKIRIYLWLWAILISIAQVYVGVHFPLDVISGGVMGITVGGFWAMIYKTRLPHNYSLLSL